MRWLVGLTISILLYLCTFALYRDALKAEFVLWDDNVQIVENQALGELSMARIVWAFTDFETASRYIPLTLLGWVVTFEFCGREPFGYHLGNLLLHCGSVVVAFWTLMAILQITTSAPRAAPVASSDQRLNRTWTLACAALGAVLWG